MNIETNGAIPGAIPGIKRLDQKQAEIGNGESIRPGVWYVDGIRTDTGSLEEANRIAKEHKITIERFRGLNEKINHRALRKVELTRR